MNNIYLKIDIDKLDKHIHSAYQNKLGVELALTDSKYIFERLESSLCYKISEIKESLPLTAHLPFYGLQLGSKDTTIRKISYDILKESICFCNELGIRRGVLHPALLPMMPKAGFKKWYSFFTHNLSSLVKIAESFNFEILVENTWEKDGFLFEKIFEDIDSPYLNMCLDIAHIYCFSEKDFNYWWRNFATKITHIHLSDNFFDEDSHLQLGQGNIPFREVFNSINKHLTYTLEVNPMNVAASLRFLNSVI